MKLFFYFTARKCVNVEHVMQNLGYKRKLEFDQALVLSEKPNGCN